jgi:hypothetical protein
MHRTLRNLEVHDRGHKRQEVIVIVSQTNPIIALLFSSCNIHGILHSNISTRLRNCLAPSGFPTKILQAFTQYYIVSSICTYISILHITFQSKHKTSKLSRSFRFPDQNSASIYAILHCLIHLHIHKQSPVHSIPGIHYKNRLRVHWSSFYIFYIFLIRIYIACSVFVKLYFNTNPWRRSHEGPKHVGLITMYNVWKQYVRYCWTEYCVIWLSTMHGMNCIKPLSISLLHHVCHTLIHFKPFFIGLPKTKFYFINQNKIFMTSTGVT